MSDEINHILTAATEKKLFQETLLPCLLRGENITAIWVPHGGKVRTMCFLEEYSHHFGYTALEKYLIIKIDSDELVECSSQVCFKLFVSRLTEKLGHQEDTPPDCFSFLKNKITRLTQEGWHLIFILGRFDEFNFPESFYENLKNIWQINKTKIHYLFAVSRNIFAKENFLKYGQLRELLSQNFVYFPLLSIEDSDFAIDYFFKKYHYKVSANQQLLAKKYGGGHPFLIRACLRLFHNSPILPIKQIPDYLLQQWEIKVILEDIWQALESEEKNFLAQIINGEDFVDPQIPYRLKALRLVQFTKKRQLEFFSPLFKIFVANQKVDAPSLGLDPQTGELLINGYPPKEKITLQEYHLLVSFLKNPNKVLSRDEIALALWGKDSDEKYSDWAIDQFISQLRKKLEKLGLPANKLQTIRNRGYRLTE